MDDFSTKIDDLPDQDFLDSMQQQKDILVDDNMKLKIKKESPSFFSSFLSYFNFDFIILILILTIRTFPLNNLIDFIPVVNSFIPSSGIFATLFTSILLAFTYVVLIQFK